MDIEINGTHIFYLPVGSPDNLPLIVLHGGPGLDHTEMHPWLDPLSDQFFLLYVDLRGQGRSARVDPASLTLELFAADVSALADALRLRRYAVLGHSFGSFVALAHAVEQGTASQYVISGGTASFTKSEPEIKHNLETFLPEELREQVTESWALEAHARTAEDAARIMEMQMSFHFARVDSAGYRRYQEHGNHTIYAPEVLAYFATAEYPVEYEDRLRLIDKPVLVITGEEDRTCTPRASRELHAGIPGSELVILPDAGHMTFIEQPEMYFTAVREFFVRTE